MRFLLALTACIGALYLPPFVPFIILVVLALRFRAHEAILLGLGMDLVWLPADITSAVPWCTLIAIMIVWALEPLRVQLLK